MAVGLSIGSYAQSDSHVCPRSSGLRLAPCCGRQAKDCDQCGLFPQAIDLNLDNGT